MRECQANTRASKIVCTTRTIMSSWQRSALYHSTKQVTEPSSPLASSCGKAVQSDGYAETYGTWFKYHTNELLQSYTCERYFKCSCSLLKWICQVTCEPYCRQTPPPSLLLPTAIQTYRSAVNPDSLTDCWSFRPIPNCLPHWWRITLWLMHLKQVYIE